MGPASALICIRDLKKTFPSTGVQALQGVSLEVFAGEVLSIVGENGAGKTTLMRILGGLTRQDTGTIEPKNYKNLVGLLNQHPLPGPGLKVWQYIILGQESCPMLGFLSEKKALDRLENLAYDYNLTLPWSNPVNTLTANQLQKTAILALLLKDPTLCIFDEPTASLHDHEAQAVLELMTRLASRGKAVVFISHKMEEVKAVSNRILVMRSGRLTATIHSPNFENLENELLSGLDPVEKAQPHPMPDSHLLLELRRAQIFPQVLGPLNLQVFTGQIYGLAGVRQDGMEALEEALSGIRPFSGGIFTLLDENVSGMGPRQLRNRGMAYVPAERRQVGSVSEATLAENLIAQRSRKLRKGLFMQKSMIFRHFEGVQTRFGFNGRPQQKLDTLSGGNLQKLLLARELVEEPRFLLLSEPSWGLDLQSQQELYRTLEQSRAGGTAILILSSDVHELLEHCDTIGALYQGQIVKEMPATLWTAATLGRAILGLPV